MTRTQKSIFSKTLAFGTIVLGVTAALSVGAADFTDPMCPDGNCTLYDFLMKILNAVVYIMFPIIVLMIVYTGFLFVVAQGNPSKIQEARRALFWTVIGALVVLGSKALALAIQATVASLRS